MPLYEYECTACHKHTEKIQKFSDPEITLCPHCGGPLERVISAPAISFKGGGWYADGYASHKPAASGETSSSDSGSSDSNSNSGGDSSATLKASSSDGGGKSESAKPAEAAKPAAPTPAPASSSSTKD